ncbi:MAG: hypothetical protein N2320_00835 [Candidatus Bipolaricaulota bacterium]|nr:hypothetical protein [Candidatus Bipolaricaulota bacterium]
MLLRRRGRPRVATRGPAPWWAGLGRDLLLGAGVGAAAGAFFQDAAFGAASGALVGLLLHLYFWLRLR